MGTQGHGPAAAASRCLEPPARAPTSLKDLVVVVKDVARFLAQPVRSALEIWLAAVDKLPKRPCNPLTELAVQVVEKAFQQSSPHMGEQEGLAWLKQHIPGVNATIGVHLDKQLAITLKRIDILVGLRTSQAQSTGGEQHAQDSRLTPQLVSLKQECALVMHALNALRATCPAAIMAMVLKDLEQAVTSSTLQGTKNRREQLSVEMELINQALKRLQEGLSVPYMYVKQFAQINAWLVTVENIPAHELSDSLVRHCRYVSTHLSVVWLYAACRFPASDTHKVSIVLLCMVSWPDIMPQAKRASARERIAPFVRSLVNRQDLLQCLVKSEGFMFWTELVGAFLSAPPSSNTWQASELPQAASQELLGCGEQAAATTSPSDLGSHMVSSSSSSSTAAPSTADGGGARSGGEQGAEHEHACMPSTSASSVQDDTTGVAVGTGGGLDDMRELLEMMYGLSELR